MTGHPGCDGFSPGQGPIEAYGNGGFRFKGMSHKGAVICLPSGIRALDVQALAGLEPAHLAGILTQHLLAGVLLIGGGRTRATLPPATERALIDAGVFYELMDTGAAARTYNVLLAEDRPVSALLIAVE